MRQRLILAAAVAGLVVLLLALNTVRNAAGWQPIALGDHRDRRR